MKVDLEVKKVKGGFEGIAKRMKNDFKNVVAGVLKGAGKYPDRPPLIAGSSSSKGPTVAQVARWNSDGTDEIPSRPFIKQTLIDKQQQYTRALAIISRLTLAGAVNAARSRRNLGIRAVRDIQASITAWSTPPNSLKTQLRKGFNDPLIHTLRLRKSISWEEEDI